MNIWLAISLILAVITIYLLLIEIFSVAFKLTGMATSKIKFQVASLFTGTGFTTTESELITNDERRRKIALTCAYTGHIFSVVIMGLVINVFFSIGINASNDFQAETFTEWYFIIFYISLGFFLLVLFLKIPPINKRFQKFLEKIAISSSKKSRKSNIMTVLDLYGKHAIVEVVLNTLPEYMKEKPLFQTGLSKDYSINVLSIKRGKRVIDVSKDTMFRKGDILVIYGLINDIKEALVNSVNVEKKVVEIDHTNEITLMNNYGQNALVEVYVDEVPTELENKTLEEANLRDQYKIIIGVIKRKDEYIRPSADTIIQKGDTIMMFGPYKNIKLLFNNENKNN